MSKSLFVTGTGTDIGKTYITALIIKKLNAVTGSAAYYKAAMSGNERDAAGNLIPGDAVFVKNIAGIGQPLEDMCPYVYENAYSPHLASRIEGNPVVMDVVKKGYEKLCGSFDYITAEGSGGILCPICFDESRIMLEDVIKELGMGCIIIADAGLGTINSVVLTVEYMRMKKIDIRGIIFNKWNPDDIMHKDNLRMCEYMTGVKVIACVTENAEAIDIDDNTLLALYKD
ncbi:MAG: dethiobiotin synthase [Lachnospiraceae bacterium]|nr:dethiobiotin synthase [Lachnospiraceae bacterium]